MDLFDPEDDEKDLPEQLDGGLEIYWSFQSRSVPPLFLICTESHFFARKIYRKAFGNDYHPPFT